MSGYLVNPSAVMAFMMPGQVIWSYVVGGVILAIGLIVIILRGDWQKARGLDKLILFGPIFYAAPLAAFGTEHFTLTAAISAIVPKFIPWHLFWTYFLGACFIAAALSIVTRIGTNLAASLLALNFFFFVVLMDAPGWAQNPHDRFALALTLRELSFSGGALALAATVCEKWRGKHVMATVARYFIAIPLLVYSFEQFRHADHVPAIPLPMVTPGYIYGHSFWTYLVAAVYAVTGIFLLVGKKTRTAAALTGATVLLVIVVVYMPIAVVQHAGFEGINYLGDTLMYCGAILLLAGAMPRLGYQEKRGL